MEDVETVMNAGARNILENSLCFDVLRIKRIRNVLPPVCLLGQTDRERGRGQLRGAAGLRSYLRSIQIILSQPCNSSPLLGCFMLPSSNMSHVIDALYVFSQAR